MVTIFSLKNKILVKWIESIANQSQIIKWISIYNGSDEKKKRKKIT